MNDAGKGCAQEESVTVIKGSQPGMPAVQLELRIVQHQEQSILSIHFKGHQQCRASVEVEHAALLNVITAG